MKTKCLVVASLVMASSFLFKGTARSAEDFPSRPVEIIICFAPGGMLDLAVRSMGDPLSKTLGVPVILTNKGGAGGAVGTEYVGKSKPDGYTVLAAPIGVFSILPFMTPNLNYKFSDFIPLCKYSNSSSLFIVKKDSPFKDFQSLISYAKRNPGKLTCASAGIGTATHFSLEMINIQAGVDIAHLPYKSGAEVNTSVLGGHVDLAAQALAPAMGLLNSGDIRALVSTSGKIEAFPNIPTIAELGYPKATLGGWTGYFLPVKTPKPIIDKLASGFEKAIKNPTVKKNLDNSGQVLDYQDSSTFTRFIIEEYKTLEEVARRAKIIK